MTTLKRLNIFIITSIFLIFIASLILAFCYIREAVFHDLYSARVCYIIDKTPYSNTSNSIDINVLISLNINWYDRNPYSPNSISKWFYGGKLNNAMSDMYYPLGSTIPCYGSFNDIRLDYYDLTWTTVLLTVFIIGSLIFLSIFIFMSIYRHCKRKNYGQIT